MQEKHLEGDGVNSEFSYELKIAGSNLFLIMLTVLSLFILAAVIGGDLVDWDVLGFEVLLPFFVAIMVCEWVKTLSDPLIDVIAVHAGSLFKWVICRYFAVFGTGSMLCILCISVFCFRMLQPLKCLLYISARLFSCRRWACLFPF